MAVRSHNGRSRSERTEDEELKILEEEFDNLTEDEKETLRVLLQEMSGKTLHGVKKIRLEDGQEFEDKGTPLFDLIQEVEFEKEVVPIDVWLKDSYFMGRSEFRWPRWREDIVELFTNGYHECILTGAIGIGKSTFVEMAMCRLIYEFSCLRDPQRTYDLMADSQIYIACLNINLDLAKRVVYDKIHARIESSPYFEKEFPCHYTQKEMVFPKGLHVIPRSSDDGSALGLNVIGGVMSETNFMEAEHGTTNKKAHRARVASWAKHGLTSDVGKVYNTLVTRLKSRFGRVGKLPGLFLLDSSKRDQSDWMEEHLLEVKDDPFVFVRDYAIWDVQPANRFSKGKFKVFVGDEKVPHRILGAGEIPVIEPGTKQQVIEVPNNWRQQFELDLDTAIRNIAGIATMNIERFFGNTNPIVDAQSRYKKEGFVSPFASDVIVVADKMPVEWSKIAKNTDGSWSLKLFPNVEHCVHLDMALSRDRFGIGCGFIAGEKKVERVFKNDEGFADAAIEKMPVIVIRWATAFQATKDRDIQLAIGRSLIWSAIEHGHKIRWGSADSWQSVETLQKMEAKGIDTETISVEGEEAYLCLRDAIVEKRLIIPDNVLLLTELSKLVHDKVEGRVDHPPKYSKDIADAVCGIVFRLTSLYLENAARPPAPAPSMGVSDFVRDEEYEEQFWVLGEGARPIEKENTPILKGGSDLSATKQRPKPFIVK